MARGTGQRREGTEMRLDMTIGGHSLDLAVPGALLKIDVMPDGTATVMAYAEAGTAVEGDPEGCLRIGPARDW